MNKLTTFLLLFISAQLSAQIEEPPFNWNKVPVVEMRTLDNEMLKEKYAQRNTKAPNKPFQFAHAIASNIDHKDFISYKDEKGNEWMALNIASEGALSINLGFDQLHLPEGAELFLYSHSEDQWIGPLKKEKRNVAEYWSPIAMGDRVGVVLKMKSEQKSKAYWHIHRVNHDFAGFKSIVSGACNVDVRCGEADGYPDIEQYRDLIRSVAVYSMNGVLTCSGVLINTADNGCEPYFLTANHCVNENSDYSSMVVYWNYENSFCRTPGSQESEEDGDGTLDQFNSGAIFRSTNPTSDFTLVEMAGEIDEDVNAFLAGWNRERQAPESVIAIHHPATEEKRISFEYDPLSITEYLSDELTNDGNYLRVEDWDVGTTEGGSSGSPIFNFQGQIVGQLHGGFANCGNDRADWYGSIYSSFIRGENSNNSLASWLDEGDSGVPFVNGIDYNSCNNLDLIFDPIQTVACSNGDSIIYSFTNLSTTDSVFLELDLNGVNASAVWSANPRLGPSGEIVLVITDLEEYDLGRNTFRVEVNSDSLVQNLQLTFEKNKTPEKPADLQPAGGGSIFPSTFFTWSQQTGVEEYVFAYSYQRSFEDSSAVVTVTGELLLNDLLPSQDLYVRLYAVNECGTSSALEREYRIENIDCKTYELSPNIQITDLNTIEVPIAIDIEGPLASTSIPKIRGTHSWISDLVVELYLDSTRSIGLLNADCGSTSDFNLGFSDFGKELLDCPITTGDIYQPSSPFSAWSGTLDVDTIWLSIEDTESFDEGNLDYVELEVCAQAVASRGFITDDFGLTMYTTDTTNLELIIDTAFFGSATQVQLQVLHAADFGFQGLPRSFLEGKANFDILTQNTPEGFYGIQFIAEGNNLRDTLNVEIEVLPCPSFPVLNEVPDTIYRYYQTFSWQDMGAEAYRFLLLDGPNPDSARVIDSQVLVDTFFRSTALSDRLTLYWTVEPLNISCFSGTPMVDSFFADVDYSVTIGPDLFRLCSNDTSSFRLQIGNRVIDRFSVSVISDTANHDISFSFDPDALQDTNVMSIQLFTGNTTPGVYDFIFVIEDDVSFTAQAQLTVEIFESGPAPELLSPEDQMTETSRLPEFQWRNSGLIAFLQVSQSPDFTNPIISESVGDVNEFSSNLVLSPFTTFYWRVIFLTFCGDLISPTWSFTTGQSVNTEELLDNLLKFHPNPMRERLFIEANGLNSGDGDVFLFDGLGRMVYRNKLSEVLENGTINTSNLVKGTYVLKIATQESVFTSKVIKQ